MGKEALVVALLLAGSAHATPHTGLVEDLAHTAAAHLGGDAPVLALYLRTESIVAVDTSSAIDTAIAALAELPGARVELYIEPTDREAGRLAEALLEASTDAQRVAVLVAFRDRRLEPRPRARIRRTVDALAVRALLRRPPDLVTAGRSFLAMGRRTIEPPDVAMLAADESGLATHAPREQPALRPRAAGRLGAHLVTIGVARLPLSERVADVLGIVVPLVDAARARVAIEVQADPSDPSLTPVEALFVRTIELASPDAALRLAAAVATHPPLDETELVWQLQAAGIDPVPLLTDDASIRAHAAWARRQRDQHPEDVGLPITIDGAFGSVADVRRLSHLPSVAHRTLR